MHPATRNAFIAIAALIAFSVGYLCPEPASITQLRALCPQEDSCRADYANGQWTVSDGDQPPVLGHLPGGMEPALGLGAVGSLP
jgi:hypothetical protein